MAQRQQGGHRCFAALYDRMTGPLERRTMLPLRRQLAGLQGDVLEIGAGTGANLPHYGPAARVFAIEPDPFMFRRAAERLARSGATNVQLCQARAEALPFRQQNFDHVVSTLVLCTVADPERALLEIHRVLKPNGRFHFVEHVRGDGRLGRIQDLIRPVYTRLAAGCQPNRRTGELIEAAGFTVEQLTARRIEFGVPLLIGTARPSRLTTPSSE